MALLPITIQITDPEITKYDNPIYNKTVILFRFTEYM